MASNAIRSRLKELRELRAQGKTRASAYDGPSDESEYEDHYDSDFVIDDDGLAEREWQGEPAQTATNSKQQTQKQQSDKQTNDKKDGNIFQLLRNRAAHKSAKPKRAVDAEIEALIGSIAKKPKVSPEGSGLPGRGLPCFSTPAFSTPTPAFRRGRFLVPPKAPSFGEVQGQTPQALAQPPQALAQTPQQTPQPLGQTPQHRAALGQTPQPLGQTPQQTPQAPALGQQAQLDLAPPSSPPPFSDSEFDSDFDNLVLPPPETPCISLASSMPTPINSDDTEIEILDTSTLKEPLRFFWSDHAALSSSSLILYGRTDHTTKPQNATIAVIVQNIARELYFLPAQGYAPVDVYNELAELLPKMGVTSLVGRPVLRKYCFGEKDIPTEADYLCVSLPFTVSESALTRLTGKTFSRVLGIGASLFERFVLSRKIMGPSWLVASSFKLGARGATAANATLVVDAKNLSTCQDQAVEAPPLSVMSISIQTKTNPQQRQEVVGISARVYSYLMGGSSKTRDLNCSALTAYRPLDKLWPLGLEKYLASKKLHVQLLNDEKALLSWFLEQMRVHDPDVIVGHNLENAQLNILLTRIRDLKVPSWKLLGRQRGDYHPPRQINQRSLREWLPGRLICDISNEMGRSVTPKCDTWNLSEMVKLYLGVTRRDLDMDATKAPWNTKDSAGLASLIMHNDTDAFLSADLAFSTQVLALSKQLTNIAGNSWHKTLSGSRSDRNEFILLHEFTNQGYIVPDKTPFRNDTKRKAKYEGGLVLEPEKGLYKSNVLVMDFNSLYPSIILEYNICFTTVDLLKYNDSPEMIPEVPTSGDLGIFPKLIKALVDRRKSVKQIMKSERDEAALARFKIREQALKLTANSMYGCLGFSNSRFYALPLAALTTHKGREILENTRLLASQQGLQVIYGDTDSVMIDTKTHTYEDAIKIGNAFKIQVDQQYRVLEIGIDNVFGAMLLYAKKKYAALNLTKTDGKLKTSIEVKGLDMRRREYCQLSKATSLHILEQIFHTSDMDVVFSNIERYLQDLAENLRKNRVPLADLAISHALGKNPQSYNDNEKQRLIQVALALRLIKQGELIKENDVVSYVVTQGEGSPTTRAYTLRELTSHNRAPDAEYYLTKQILPPIERLCEMLDGISRNRLSEWLGIRAKKQLPPPSTPYTEPVEPQGPFRLPAQLLAMFETVSDSTEPFNVECHECHQTFPYASGSPTLTPNGLTCPKCQCVQCPLVLAGQVRAQVESLVQRYYRGWINCDDESCDFRTRQIPLGGHCLGSNGHCGGELRFEFSDRDLLSRLNRLRRIFDFNAQGRSGLARSAKVSFEPACNVLNGYLGRNGRRFINMDRFF